MSAGSWSTIVLLVASCASCAGERPRDLQWQFAFDAAVERGRLVALRASVLAGGCDGASPAHETWLAAAGRGDAPPELPPGTWGFSGVAYDATCAPFARGCREVVLPLDDDAVVEVVLGPGDETPQCAPGSCVAGRCGGDADGSVACPGLPPRGCQDCPEACVGGEACVGARCSRGGVHDWSRTFGSAGLEQLSAVAVAADGRIALTGAIGGPADLGGGVLPHAGATDVLLATFGPDGSHGMSRSFGGGGQERGRGVAFGPTGELWIVGGADGPIDFGGARMTPSAADAFVAAFAPDGRLFWADLFGGLRNDELVDVAVQPSGAAVAVGYYEESADFGSGVLPRWSRRNGVAAAYATSGAREWSYPIGGDDDALANAVAVDGAGSVYVVGDFRGAVDFGDGLISASGLRDAFVLALDADGGFRWVRTYGGGAGATAVAQDVTVSSDGRIVVVGRFDGTVSFGLGTSSGGDDAFVLVLDAAGVTAAVQDYGADAVDAASAVAADGFGNVVVGGHYGSSVAVGGAPLPWVSAEEAFVAAYAAADVSHQWSRGFTAPMLQVVNDLALDRAGFVVVTGRTLDAVDLGGGPVLHLGGGDLFLARFAD